MRAAARQRYAPFAVEHLPARDGHTKLAGIKAELIQMRDQRRLRHDAGAAAGKLAGHPLVDVDIPAAPPQHQCG